jgi:hypothetical protein
MSRAPFASTTAVINDANAAKYLSCAETAKLVRQTLKRAFPTTKFSVRSDEYSMGASIRVRWTDGASLEAVENIAHEFNGTGFDGMIDLKYYHKHWLLPDGSVQLASSPGTTGSMGVHEPEECPKPHPDAVLVSLGADSVSCDRTISEDLRQRICKDIAPMIAKEFTGNMDQNVRDDDWITWHNLVYRLTRKADLTRYGGIAPTGCTCGTFPDDFFRVTP